MPVTLPSPKFEWYCRRNCQKENNCLFCDEARAKRGTRLLDRVALQESPQRSKESYQRDLGQWGRQTCVRANKTQTHSFNNFIDTRPNSRTIRDDFVTSGAYSISRCSSSTSSSFFCGCRDASILMSCWHPRMKEELRTVEPPGVGLRGIQSPSKA